MELQWPLIIFTALVAWSAGVFGAQAVLALGGNAKKAQMPSLIVSLVLLVAGGIAVFFHLEHWERIFNGFGHITSGITQELILIVLFAVVAVVYFVLLRKSEDGTSVPKWAAILAIVVAVALVGIMAHSYMMAARPAWNSFWWVLCVLGNACVLGPATVAIIMAFVGDELKPVGWLAIIGAAINVVTAVGFALFVLGVAPEFVTVDGFIDPTFPARVVTDAAAVLAAQTPLIWGGVVALGAVAPLIAVLVAKFVGKPCAWKILGIVAVVCAILGALAVRVVFYNAGLSMFLIF